MVFLNSHVCITASQNNRTLFIKWLTFAKSDEYRFALQEAAKIIEALDLDICIMDSRRLGAPTIGDQSWTVTNFVSLLAANNFRKLARILSYDIFQHLAYEHITERSDELYQLPFETAYFVKTQDALEWAIQDMDIAKLPGFFSVEERRYFI
jgi:hypothetical protein